MKTRPTQSTFDQPRPVAAIAVAPHLYTVVHCANDVYAIAKDGWIADERRWDKEHLDRALIECVIASGAEGPIQILYRNEAGAN